MGGRPSALGSGRSGPRGVGRPPSLLPQTPLSHPHPHGAGAPCRAPLVLSAAAVGRGLPGGRGAGWARVPRECAPRVPRGVGGGEVGTPRAPVGCPSPPRLRVGAGCPVVKPPGPSGLLFSVCLTWPARGNPSGGLCRATGGDPAETPRNQTRTTLSGGSLGSCVDEERS